MGLKSYTYKVTTAGTAGSATGTSTGEFSATDNTLVIGEILAVQVDFHSSAPAGTTDLKIESSEPSDTILSVTNTATDVIYYPRNIVHSNAGVAATAGDNLFAPFVVNGFLTVTVSQCNALTNAAVVKVWVRT